MHTYMIYTPSITLNPFSPAFDSKSGTTKLFYPPAPDLGSGTETHFIKLVLEVAKLCIIIKEGR